MSCVVCLGAEFGWFFLGALRQNARDPGAPLRLTSCCCCCCLLAPTSGTTGTIGARRGWAPEETRYRRFRYVSSSRSTATVRRRRKSSSPDSRARAVERVASKGVSRMSMAILGPQC